MSDAPAETSKPYEAFYAGAIAGLRALDAREGRRFSPAAEERWAHFAGALTTGDRVDLMLRDAAVRWGAAFSPALSFGLTGVAPDDPFGPSWVPLGKSQAERLMRAAPVEQLKALGALYGVAPAALELPDFTPSTRVSVAGAGALLAVAERFLGEDKLDWSKQVLAVAEAPATRQLAGLLAVFLAAPFATTLVRPASEVQPVLKAAGFARPEQAVVSADAEPACAEFARRAAGEA